ncbi:hypothetical protein V8C35DRAFT_315449 [Trichoderma chlorosporum]
MVIESLTYNNRQDIVANAKEAWENLNIKTINGYIDSMRDWLKAVLELEEKISRYWI